MTNESVVENWYNGISGKSLNMDTDGKSLFSYEMKIGETHIVKEAGFLTKKKVGLNVQSPFFYSQTTSHHVGLVKRYADEMIDPVSIKKGYSLWYLFP
jgi:hypothetical protein